MNSLRLTDLAHCKGWIRDKSAGCIKHESGRFFRIVGIHDGERYRIMLQQDDHGQVVLAMIKLHYAYRFLLWDKWEPGTILKHQLAATCQSTRSNLDNVHGGKHPPGHDLANLPGKLQSECEGHWICKSNVTTTIHKPSNDSVIPEHYALGEEQLKSFLRSDFVVHQDLASVLACVDWKTTFTPSDTHLAGQLWDSLQARLVGANDILESARMNNTHAAVTIIDVAEAEEKSKETIAYVSVESDETECAAWCQPLLCRHPEFVTLVTFMHNDIRRFAVVLKDDPCLANHVQYAPTFSGSVPHNLKLRQLLSVTNQDEGARFLHATTKYTIAECDENDAHLIRGFYLTLGELNELAMSELCLTSDLRTCLSLVLGLM